MNCYAFKGGSGTASRRVGYGSSHTFTVGAFVQANFGSRRELVVAGVPVDLEEAAMIDGCTRSQAFWKVTFPLLAPGLVATGVFAFIQSWNEFTMALLLLRGQNLTLPPWLLSFQSATEATNWGAVMAASTLISIPVVVFFLIVQGRMSGGLVSGAVKG